MDITNKKSFKFEAPPYGVFNKIEKYFLKYLTDI